VNDHVKAASRESKIGRRLMNEFNVKVVFCGLLHCGGVSMSIPTRSGTESSLPRTQPYPHPMSSTLPGRSDKTALITNGNRPPVDIAISNLRIWFLDLRMVSEARKASNTARGHEKVPTVGQFEGIIFGQIKTSLSAEHPPRVSPGR
jgi:hypothetical protein